MKVPVLVVKGVKVRQLICIYQTMFFLFVCICMYMSAIHPQSTDQSNKSWQMIAFDIAYTNLPIRRRNSMKQ